MSRFSIGRADGRSNQQVIIDMLKKRDIPGVTFTYEDIQVALKDSSDRVFSIHDVQSIVRASLKRLERECQRTLLNVRGTGYRIAYAKDHMSVAHIRETKANTQMRAALSVLRNVKFEEMDENTRKLHQGTLMVVSAVYEQQQSLMRRQNAVERAIVILTEKVHEMSRNTAA